MLVVSLGGSPSLRSRSGVLLDRASGQRSGSDDRRALHADGAILQLEVGLGYLQLDPISTVAPPLDAGPAADVAAGRVKRAPLWMQPP